MTLIHSTVKPGMGVGGGATDPALGTSKVTAESTGFTFLQHTDLLQRSCYSHFPEEPSGLTQRADIMCSEWI